MTKILYVGDDADCLPTLACALADTDAAEIVLEPGVYVEHVVVAPRKGPLLIRSSTNDPADVTVTFGLRQGDRDRTGMEYVQSCATLTIESDDVTLRAITVENTFDKTKQVGVPNTQALALRTTADRFVAERCRFLGQQDTVLLDAPSWAAIRRVHLRDCEIVGDVDFIYGRATALIEGGLIRSVGPGYIAAPSTALENLRGFLFWEVDIVADLPAGSVKLGRPWHPGGKPDAVGQAIFAHCTLGEHISPEPWTEMGGFDWEDARFAEYENTGPGAAPGVGRPQLEAAPDRCGWLDGWDPIPVEVRRIVVVSDSTASHYGVEHAPRTGWAQQLEELLHVPVCNLAVSGASSRSFIASGALDHALGGLSAGDLFLIAFGHNDTKPDERFSDVFTQYEANLRRYIVGARARGALPVLLTPVERRRFVDGRARGTHGGYPARVRALAQEERLMLVDLTTATRNLWQQQGEEDSKESFLWLEPGTWPGFPDGEQDDTHLSVSGATAVARIVAEAIGTFILRQPEG
ncbi:pectinesterase family protein [Pseudarthrobacter sp. efr-133-R2A-89]|uniref:pectinesterase family protein n=1 Tax=Pseudarthrobacter sp. efr-133-R2A-89 TaxID=3040302 RepID=UPI00255339A1|nr:pectinesterase family protein [Pseudarthrobacter sp. efr-133-R2A-89]